MENGKQKNILLISYYFPPAGGGGVMRMYHTALILSQKGYSVTVVTPQYAHYDVHDQSLAKQIVDSKVKVVRIGQLRDIIVRHNQIETSANPGVIGNLGFVGHIKQSIRSLLYSLLNIFPDPEIDWVLPVILKLHNLGNISRYDIVWTSGPPHSIHFIGYFLKLKGIRFTWVTDFRDLWVQNSYNRSRSIIWRAINKRYEKAIALKSDKVLFTSISSKSTFIMDHPKDSKKMYYCPNGYWEEEFVVCDEKHDETIILFTGRFYPERVSYNLLEALRDINNTHNVKFIIAGPNLPIEMEKFIYEQGINPYVNYLGYLSRQETLMLQAKCDLMINIEMSDEAIPGKVFEYMGQNKPILQIGSESSASTILLREYENTLYVLDDYEMIYSSLDLVASGKFKLRNSEVKNQYNRRLIIDRILAEIVCE